jgi:hypothetical protein
MISHYFRFARILWFILVLAFPLFIQSQSLAAIGEDTEKPVPEFTRAGETITAKLIPRAKSTSVLIDFETAQGKLTDVKGIEFETLRTPELDIKEFKSSFFDVNVDLPPGSEAEITISSSFFTVSTEYWLYNSKKPAKCFNSGVKTDKGSDNVNQFVFRVTDGGEFDSDGVANGRIQLIGGPKDSFWSYALGTLVVRFFGVFLVLSALMIGMLSAGQLFIALEKRRGRLAPPPYQAPKPAPALRAVPIKGPDAHPSAPDPDTVAAIATALHLHLVPKTSRDAVDGKRADQNSWVQYGRVEIQNTRIQTFQRPINPKKHI